ncbi:MAG: prolyl oligopeptidase family serine peptidase [Muribaculaceae bacterium]|nr:prolyl oligopeptidase family serine peptidase [Muribaculaceae bacterium]
MKKLLFMLCLCAFSILQAQDYKTVKVDGTVRQYLEYVPQGLGENRPLIIALHGNSGHGSYHKGQMRVESVADTAKFVTVFPNGIDRTWDIGGDKDLNFMQALIDEMYRKYKIDRNRVYLTGWSMGGMFTYYAMMKAADKFAAYAPMSGYHFWGGKAESSRPVPILHIHGKDDDVVTVGNLQGELNKWINRNKCNRTAKTTKKYRNVDKANLYVWDGGTDGVEVRYLEIEGMKHAIWNTGFKSIEEIWNFCSRYSLNNKFPEDTAPTVTVTSPAPYTSYTVFAPATALAFPDITLSAEAEDSNGSIAKVEFFDGDTMVGSCSGTPYVCVLPSPQAGKHTIKVVATDNDGETGESTVTINLNAPESIFSFHDDFKNQEGCLPAGWTTYDGSDLRTGYLEGLSQGARVFRFTGNPHDFDWGLYFRNMTGASRAGYARYAPENSVASLRLYPGQYILTYKICNWNRPQFNSPVDVIIENREGHTVASQQFTPTVNIGNRATLPFKGVEEQTLTFTIDKDDFYVLTFYADDQEWGDAVIGGLTLTALEYDLSDVGEIKASEKDDDNAVFSLQGIRSRTPQTKGIYISNGKKYISKPK